MRSAASGRSTRTATALSSPARSRASAPGAETHTSPPPAQGGRSGGGRLEREIEPAERPPPRPPPRAGEGVPWSVHVVVGEGETLRFGVELLHDLEVFLDERRSARLAPAEAVGDERRRDQGLDV